MSKEIWVYIDHFKGSSAPSSWEALGVARRLAGETGAKVTALVFGQGLDELVQKAGEYGADLVKVCDDATLADFRVQPYAALLVKLAGEEMPELILGPAALRVRDVFGTAAVELETGVIVDAVSLEPVDGSVEVTRPVYAGKLMSVVQCRTRPQMVTLRPRAFPLPEAAAGRAAEVVKVSPVLTEAEITTQVVDYVGETGEVSVDGAAVIVSGGRGVGGPEGFEPVRQLAKVLGAAIGASRAAVDAGWIPYAHQVGQTGKVVSPNLYIAAGISGAVQHQAGMRTAKVIVAINKDRDAPIFNMAKYGIVGDLFEVLPSLTEEFKKRLGK
jgi:electron transfer flavoprotein alpha subunit